MNLGRYNVFDGTNALDLAPHSIPDLPRKMAFDILPMSFAMSLSQL
jgi:hypothetical protein